MSGNSDFVIENGVLVKYNGPGGDVVIPEGVRKIGAEVFSNCSALTSVSIPQSLQSISFTAFTGCTALKQFDVPEDHPRFQADGPLLLSRDGSTLILAPAVSGDFSAPEAITAIADGAFYENTALEQVTLPEGLKRIGEEAFSRCFQLKRVLFPESLNEMGDAAFALCLNLTHINYPKRSKVFQRSFWELSKPKFSKLSCFNSCPVNEIDVAEGHPKFRNVGDVILSQDGKNLVWCSPKLSGEYAVPDGVQVIENGAFHNCKHLTSVRVPDSVMVIQPDAMMGCSAALCVKRFAISDFPSAPNFIRYNVISGFAKLYQAGEKLPEEIQNENLKYIKRTRSLYYRSLPQDQDLRELMLAEKMIPLKDTETLIQQADADGQVEFADRLRSYLETDIPPAARKRAQDAKRQLTEQTAKGELTLSQGKKLYQLEQTPRKTIRLLRYMGTEKDIQVPRKIGDSKVVEIGEKTFSPDRHITWEKREVYKQIERIVIPSGVRKIAAKAFYDCTGLKEVVLPASIKEIDSSAFGRNYTSRPLDCTIHAPAGSYAEQYAKEHNIPFQAL